MLMTKGTRDNCSKKYIEVGAGKKELQTNANS
jgi:hypothetical protein